MRVLIVTVGSRGDVAPFTGLGTALQSAGHTVTIAGYEMFAGLVTDCGLGFRALPGDPRMLAAATWRRAGAGPVGAARLIRLAADHLRELHAGMLVAARQDTDVLLLAGLASIGGYHIAEGLGRPSMGLGLAPIYPTAEFAPPVVTARSLGRWGNRAAGQALVGLGSPMLAGPVRELRAELGLARLGSREAIFGQQHARYWPAFYGFSPSVVPRPADWRDGLEVTGYWWPVSPAGWKPPAELEEFLDAGPPPVFFGLGSMRPGDAGRMLSLAAAAGQKAGARMLIQDTTGADVTEAGRPRDSLVIGEAPHEWLFPQTAAVIHHAGAGTTAAGLRAGVPAVGVPMLGDQPFWAARLTGLGAAPRAIPYQRLTVAALTAAITEVTTRSIYRERARAVAGRLGHEDGTGPVISAMARLSS